MQIDTPAPETVQLAEFAPYLMNRIMGRYNASLQDQMAELGLTTPKMRALAALAATGPVLIKDLAVYTVTEQSTLSRALDKLEANGLIRRAPDPSDGRAVRIDITDTGRAAYERLRPDMLAAQDAMFTGISPDEKAAFLATLHTILRNVRKHDI